MRQLTSTTLGVGFFSAWRTGALAVVAVVVAFVLAIVVLPRVPFLWSANEGRLISVDSAAPVRDLYRGPTGRRDGFGRHLKHPASSLLD